MLNRITIAGFKSFPNHSIPLRRLSLLSGLNNSGKSSILQAIRMFCNSYETQTPLLSGHGGVDEIRSRLVNPKDEIIFECELENKINTKLILSENSFLAPSIAPLLYYISADRLGPKINLPIDRKFGGGPTIGEHGEYVVGFLEALRNSVIPKELHHPESQGSTLEYEINGWLREIAPGVKLVYATDSKRDMAHVEFDNYRPTNTGFGLSYSLPILAVILGSIGLKPASGWEYDWGDKWEIERKDRGLVVILENPEAHLHPKGQTALGRLISIASNYGVQFIVETQSDHLMDGIRISIKEKLLSNDAVVFHYLKKNDNGGTVLETPEIDTSGKLSFWPDGFFDQAVKNKATLSRS